MVACDNLTVVNARVVGTETVDLQGSIQRIGSVSWEPDAANESLIHLDCITFGKGTLLAYKMCVLTLSSFCKCIAP